MKPPAGFDLDQNQLFSRPIHVLSAINFCLDSLWGEGAELHQPRRHPKAFGIPSNLLTGTPSSVPCPTPTHVGGKELH